MSEPHQFVGAARAPCAACGVSRDDTIGFDRAVHMLGTDERERWMRVGYIIARDGAHAGDGPGVYFDYADEELTKAAAALYTESPA